MITVRCPSCLRRREIEIPKNNGRTEKPCISCAKRYDPNQGRLFDDVVIMDLVDRCVDHRGVDYESYLHRYKKSFDTANT